MSKINFKFKINLVEGMRVTTFRIDEKKLTAKDLLDLSSPNDANIIEGEISIIPITEFIEVSVWGVGQPNLVGTFNITYKDKKIFSEEQKLIVTSGARFRFYKEKVKIPS